MGYAEMIPLDQCDRCDSCNRIVPKVELQAIRADGLTLMFECKRCLHGK